MTDNQFNQLFGLVTKSVESTQRLEKIVAEMKQDVSELKEGQAKLEEGQAEIKKELRIMNRSMTLLAKD